jgi:hypothetical protein
LSGGVRGADRSADIPVRLSAKREQSFDYDGLGLSVLRTLADTDVRAPIPIAPGTDLIHHHCSISLDQEPTGFSGALIFHQKKTKFSAERNNSETSRLAL